MHDNTRSEEGTVVILVKFVSQVVSFSMYNALVMAYAGLISSLF